MTLSYVFLSSGSLNVLFRAPPVDVMTPQSTMDFWLLYKIDFVPNTYSPIFRKFRVANEEDIDKLDELRGTKDYIDLAISNNLLINNRKLRRKLEVMLGKGNFASVEYIDDITKDLVDGEEVNESNEVEFDENGIEISVQLEYEDYIKEYILKQSYDNDKFKSGIVNEFDEVIKIYNENYKVKAD